MEPVFAPDTVCSYFMFDVMRVAWSPVTEMQSNRRTNEWPTRHQPHALSTVAYPQVVHR